ncbi:hypothetical protein T07_3384 [Trichinella nelsoni]|uniref:Uncharacterized protein n=1 Tax=Trichinella nelsoni TaxID=6336 RepID=A0A0V0SI00_9BILA|nr:hypothetical protein T07_3384 [Trichinella nelsoni]
MRSSFNVCASQCIIVRRFVRQTTGTGLTVIDWKIGFSRTVFIHQCCYFHVLEQKQQKKSEANENEETCRRKSVRNE